MAGLSGAFLDNELSYEALFRNVIGLTVVLLLCCHWMSFLIILIFLLQTGIRWIHRSAMKPCRFPEAKRPGSVWPEV